EPQRQDRRVASPAHQAQAVAAHFGAADAIRCELVRGPGGRTETLTEALQGLLTGSGIAGLVVGLLLASVPLVWLLLRRGQRSAAPSRNDAAATHRRNQAIVEGAGEGVLELDNVGQV